MQWKWTDEPPGPESYHRKLPGGPYLALHTGSRVTPCLPPPVTLKAEPEAPGRTEPLRPAHLGVDLLEQLHGADLWAGLWQAEVGLGLEHGTQQCGPLLWGKALLREQLLKLQTIPGHLLQTPSGGEGVQWVGRKGHLHTHPAGPGCHLVVSTYLRMVVTSWSTRPMHCRMEV